MQALAGSNRDVVANRRAIRMANMSAAEVLKAELAGLQPVKKSASSFTSTPTPAVPPPPPQQHIEVDTPPPAVVATMEDDDSEIPGLGVNGPVDTSPDVHMRSESSTQESPQGHKRKAEEVEEEDAELDAESAEVVEVEVDDDDDAPPDVDAATAALALKVNPDGTVEQEDTVKCACVVYCIGSKLIDILQTVGTWL